MEALTREEFIVSLESVKPGLASGKAILEQSGNFIFQGGTVSSLWAKGVQS